MGWVEGLSKKKIKEKLMDHSVVIARGQGVQRGRGRYRGVNGDGQRHDLGGVPTIQCTGDV